MKTAGMSGSFASGAGYVIGLLLVILMEAVLFWNGIIRVYTTSVQLGIKWRVIGIACGFIPFVHIWALCRIIAIASREAAFEDEKYLLDQVRAENHLCHTKYPLLLVHGVFFRDFRFFNYWGRVPYALKKFGDADPDFLSAVRDLTASSCERRNEKLPDRPDVFYQSVGSRMNHASGGRFPLNMAYPFVRHFDGANDGLVSVESARWGEAFTELAVPEGRGISHGDMIDLNRENIPGFDVREFYVNLVGRLKEKGF